MGMFDFASIRRSVTSLEEQLQKMRAEAEDLRRQRDRVLSTPGSKEDLKAMLAAWCASNAEKKRIALRETLSKFARNPRNMNARELAHVMSLTGSPESFGNELRTADVDQALCALFAPILQKALADEIDSMEWSEDAMTNVQREAAAGRLTDRIDKLDIEITDLIKSAEDAGIAWAR